MAKCSHDDHSQDDRSVDVRPDEHLTYLMAKVEHLLERRIDDAVGQVGLTLRQFSALAHIGRRPGLSSSDLARALLITPQAVNTLVARLIAAGLVDKAPSRSRQPLVLALTDTGLDALLRAAPLATRAEATALAHLTTTELETIHRTLLRLLEHLTEHQATADGEQLV
jgi:DNA-binding MarR family transcriptional regulator